MARVAFPAFSLLCTMSVLAADKPPTPYVDKGACPFEGCAYREWTAKQDIQLFDRPNGNHRVGVLHKGDRVTGLTGEVHSVPILVHAAENVPDPNNPEHTAIPKGAPFYVIHYEGEGDWLSWYLGRLISVENFNDAGPFPQATWWVKVKTAQGLIGWAISDRNFDGQDSLG